MFSEASTALVVRVDYDWNRVHDCYDVRLRLKVQDGSMTSCAYRAGRENDIPFRGDTVMVEKDAYGVWQTILTDDART